MHGWDVWTDGFGAGLELVVDGTEITSYLAHGTGGACAKGRPFCGRIGQGGAAHGQEDREDREEGLERLHLDKAVSERAEIDRT